MIVADDNPSYVLSVVALETTNALGAKTGVAMSVVWTEPLHSDIFDMVSKGKLDPADTVFTRELIRRGSIIVDHRVMALPMSAIERNAKSIIAEFDAERLEPQRKQIQELEEGNPQR